MHVCVCVDVCVDGVCVYECMWVGRWARMPCVKFVFLFLFYTAFVCSSFHPSCFFRADCHVTSAPPPSLSSPQIPNAYGVPLAVANTAYEAARAMDRFPVADADSVPLTDQTGEGL